MAYRTILVHLDPTANAAPRIRLAAHLAERDDAHLVGTALSGLRRYMYAGSPFDISGAIAAGYLDAVARQAEQALAQFDRITAQIGVQSVERRKREEDDYAGLCLQALYADLVVLGQPDPEHSVDGAPLADLAPHVILNCGRPVLLVPKEGAADSISRHALVAWNGSVEAARAVSAAIPLLRHVGRVTVALFGEQAQAEQREAGADIALYLARHQLQVEVQRRSAPVDTGNAILSLAADLGADLLVAGAYGHSRFREMLLGGATRTILSAMSLPVLMAH
ncbi:universal stress protein [Duganella callida]|uniref:Universal stress protein n=1 Tax=Duganella callida TaxID=2561932 RepID=A0A4Y9SGF9_9BURK|nr:universal stress protein [Duganella callida]TFW23132.1 universal stress protein [Duganella callida]